MYMYNRRSGGKFVCPVGTVEANVQTQRAQGTRLQTLMMLDNAVSLPFGTANDKAVPARTHRTRWWGSKAGNDTGARAELKALSCFMCVYMSVYKHACVRVCGLHCVCMCLLVCLCVSSSIALLLPF